MPGGQPRAGEFEDVVAEDQVEADGGPVRLGVGDAEVSQAAEPAEPVAGERLLQGLQVPVEDGYNAGRLSWRTL
jgi:hypothetical protein